MIETRTSISRPFTRKFNTTVLRHAFLGDVQLRHDLQATDNRRLKSVHLRRCWLTLQDTVDAVTKLDAGFLSFDVNVTGPRFDRFA